MIGLLQKITSVLLDRIRNFVNLSDLSRPEVALENADNSLVLLDAWIDAFHRTRIAIESSERETRWEFSVHHIFRPVHHFKLVCGDVSHVAKELIRIRSCFSEDLAKASSNYEVMAAGNSIHTILQSFVSPDALGM